MSVRHYTLPVEQTRWSIPGTGDVATFTWEYDEPRDRLLKLYEKGKTKQWNANTRIDWSGEVDRSNPLGFPDSFIALGPELWETFDDETKAQVRYHLAAWRFSQFLHGEQGALVCSAQIVQTVPDVDAKYYAATQVMDEARHMEVFSRYLYEKLELAYPINVHLKTLLDQAISDPRWDLTYLAMQVIIEGLALAAFQMIRDMAGEPLAKSLCAYVMEDEARHVAFGRLALRDYYPQLTQRERDEREEFAVEACYLMRDRFLGEEVWEALGMNVKECVDSVKDSETMNTFRKMLFSRIVPTIKDIGLWGDKIQKAFADMGVLEFSALDPETLGVADEESAAEFDRQLAERRAQVDEAVALGEGGGSE